MRLVVYFLLLLTNLILCYMGQIDFNTYWLVFVLLILFTLKNKFI